MGFLLGGLQKRQAFPEPPVPAYSGAANDYLRNVAAPLTSPTLWSCVMLIANSVAMLPVQTFKLGADQIPQRATDPSFLLEPQNGFRQSEWIHAVMLSLLLRGNAYGIVTKFLADQKTPDQVVLVNPDQVKLEVSDNGTVTYFVGRNREKHYSLTDGRGDMWHVRGYTLPGSPMGLSPLSYAEQMLNLDASARRFAGDFFNGSNIPKALLTTAQVIDQAQARTAKDRIIAATTTREPLVLGGDWKYQPLTVAPNESQFIETQRFADNQIAKFFNVPPEMVGSEAGNSMTYANVEQRSLDFLTYCIAPWLRRLEDALYVFAPGKTNYKFDTDVLLRTDAETRAKIDVQLIAARIVTPTEVRARRNLPEMTDAQKAEVNMVPMAPTPMGGVKTLPAATEPGGPPAKAPTAPNDSSNNGEETQ